MYQLSVGILLSVYFWFFFYLNHDTLNHFNELHESILKNVKIITDHSIKPSSQHNCTRASKRYMLSNHSHETSFIYLIQIYKRLMLLLYLRGS